MANLETKKRNHGLIIGSRALGATRAAGHGPTPRVAHKTDYPMVAAFELARGFDADDAVRLDDVWPPLPRRRWRGRGSAYAAKAQLVLHIEYGPGEMPAASQAE
jgi:hypothetical protein